MGLNRKPKICVVTACRSEYGLLRWIMADLKQSNALSVQVLVTGAHLDERMGNTFKELELDGLQIDAKVPMDLGDLSSGSLAKAMGQCGTGVADAFSRLSPDMIVVLGDRYELLPVVSTALIMRLPVAHISGGDETEGAFDNEIRHAISQMSTIHFPGVEDSRSRLIKMGLPPSTIHVVGEPGLDNFIRLNLMSKADLAHSFKIDFDRKWVLITFHPETKVDMSTNLNRLSAIMSSLGKISNLSVVATYPNADPGSQEIINFLENFRSENIQFKLYKNLGQTNYLSFLNSCDLVIGNSSSIIFETPYLGVPSILVGNRQSGRYISENIAKLTGEESVDVSTVTAMISQQIKDSRFKSSTFFGDGTSSKKIIAEIEGFFGH